MVLQPKKSAKNGLFEETSYEAIQAAHRKKWTLIGTFVLILGIIVALIVKDRVSVNTHEKIANEYAGIDLLYQQETARFQQKAKETSQAKNSEPDYSQSMVLFSKFALKNKDNPYGWQAAIRSSTYFIAKNKNNEAREVLEAILPSAQDIPFIQFKARMALAGIYASEKNTPNALGELDKIESLPNGLMQNQARLLKAQILFTSGNKKEAQKILNQIISQSPSPKNNLPGDSSAQEDQTQKQAELWLSTIGV